MKTFREFQESKCKVCKKKECICDVKTEGNEYRAELARERRAERETEDSWRKTGKVGQKKSGPKLSTTKHSKRRGSDYAEKEMRSISAHDTVTRKAKHTVGNPFPEEVQYDLEEGMTLKQFKANRKKNERRAATADARKRGHEGSEWHNTGRTYSTGEAQSRRANMTDDDRAARKRAAIDPDDDRDENTYSADRTKNPKKQRKQDAMGEARNPYAIGMAKAQDITGDTPPLKKSTITKAHRIAKAIKKDK